jgi:hypothetical protein
MMVGLMTEYPSYLVYLVYTAILGITLVALVPKKDIKRLFFCGVVLGGMYNVFWAAFAKAFGLGGFINFGPFGFLGIPFFPPIAWSAYFIMYFYFLPKKGVVPYILGAIVPIYNVFFANVLQHLNIFKWNKSPVLLLLLYITWHITATWGYFKFSHLLNPFINRSSVEAMKKRFKSTVPIRLTQQYAKKPLKEVGPKENISKSRERVK